MLIFRLSSLLIILGISGSLMMWALTGDTRYRKWAWNTFRFGIIVLFVFLSMFALERVLIPLV